MKPRVRTGKKKTPRRKKLAMQLRRSRVKIAASLLALRRAARKTQDDLRTKINMIPAQIVKLERGQENYTIDTLLTYLDAVNGRLTIGRVKHPHYPPKISRSQKNKRRKSPRKNNVRQTRLAIRRAGKSGRLPK